MKRVIHIMLALVVSATLLSACATSTPQVVIQTQIVPQVQTQVVEKTVVVPQVQTQVVEKTVVVPQVQTQVVEKQVTAAPATYKKEGTLFWVIVLKGHPVVQMTQVAFLKGCQALGGYKCEIVTIDDTNIDNLINLAEQALARPDAAGFCVFGGSPAFLPLYQKIADKGLPVVLPHFVELEDPGLSGIISTDPAAYAVDAAQNVCKAIGDKKGSVAITQGAFNSTENTVAENFAKTMKKECPNVTVLDPEIEGFDPAQAVAKGVAIMKAHPDLIAAMSTTGGGPTTWAGAQKETNKKIIAVGMDYTGPNLQLLQDDQIYALVGQPLWEESYQCPNLLDQVRQGKTIPYWTKLPAPFITKAEAPKYADYVKQVEDAVKGGLLK
jgi:ribose transport system substrate-binding protein